MEGCGPLLKDFKAKLQTDENIKQKIATLKAKVENFALQYPMPGLDGW